MNIVSTIKITEILKYTWFHVIPYIHSPVMGLFPLFPHILNTQYIYIYIKYTKYILARTNY